MSADILEELNADTQDIHNELYNKGLIVWRGLSSYS